ncbi:glucosamine-6-phosphate deaminase [Caldanaerobius fijiensis DSM 17918]|uniref:Glucosamine-6-phosphate deaminase n=1 Tax=Caldanaerobius fijiensis DSM 17918 TaxID=1121256 RepID=A0A1M4Y3I9_9THEO|nr:glucosamine-6-phosphate deaminase [Caldanaerobius fijiensis]SHF00143.1 glucosamine-6-phosphate deaminase [Caldanaerobius fijiensis DSM 17918]
MSYIKNFKVDNLEVFISENRDEMGKLAARDVHDRILELLEEKDAINMVFAAAPSQNEFLASLVSYDDVDWGRINAFHLDEYIGLSIEAPQRFANFLKDRIFGKVGFKSVNYIDGNAQDIEAECRRYSELLKEHPIDIGCIGIGENGHIAFNDPWVADFNDKKLVKVVELDERCRMQQVHDGCFSSLDEVPRYAITLTIPTIMSSQFIYCIVPAKTKAEAVYNTLKGDIVEDCPASILRTHPRAYLYLDMDSAEKII